MRQTELALGLRSHWTGPAMVDSRDMRHLMTWLSDAADFHAVLTTRAELLRRKQMLSRN